MAEQELEAKGEQEEPPKKKGGKMLLIFGLVLGLGGGGAAGALFLAPMIGERLAAGPESEAAPDPDEDAGGGGGSHGEEADDHAEGSSASVGVHVIDNLVVNPAGSNGTRFLLADVAFETTHEAMEAVLEARDLELRDALIRVLGMKTVAQLTDYTARDALVAELKSTLEHLLGEGSVTRIFLPQYVIQ